MTTKQRLKRLDMLERKIESSFMPYYKKVRKILQQNRNKIPTAKPPSSDVVPCPWNDLVLSNETVEGYII